VADRAGFRRGGIQPGHAAIDRSQDTAGLIDGDPPAVIFILEIDAGQVRGGNCREVRREGSRAGGGDGRVGLG
jgi:hypothetical protein